MSGADFFADHTTLDMVGRLYTAYFDTVKSQTTNSDKRTYSAAFQIALWELVYDAAAPNLGVDRFTNRGTRNKTERAIANKFLSSLPSVSNKFQMFVLQSDTSQDLLIVNPVPPEVSEPATIATLSLALLVLARRSFKRK
jgi:hypothetical protein